MVSSTVSAVAATFGIARDAELGDDDVAVVGGHGRVARVEDEEPAVALVLRMEGEPEQAALAAGQNLGVDVEELRRRRGARLQDADVPGALDDEEPVGVVAGVADEERARKAGRDDGIELDGGERGG